MSGKVTNSHIVCLFGLELHPRRAYTQEHRWKALKHLQAEAAAELDATLLVILDWALNGEL